MISKKFAEPEILTYDWLRESDFDPNWRTYVNKKTITAGSTTREVTVDRQTVIEADLTHKEEQVLRMLHGVGAAADHRLEKRGEEHPETRAKLALIEQMLLSRFTEKKPQSKREKIIEQLKKL